MQTILELQEMTADLPAFLAIAGQVGVAVAALLQCFFGFRLLRFWVAAAGFVLGAYAGFRYLAPLVFSEESAAYLPYLIALLGGVVVSILSYKLFRLGLFLFTGLVAAGAVASAWETSGNVLSGGWQNGIGLVLPIGAFLLAGWLAIRFFRTAVIGVTGIGGAWIATDTLSKLLPQYFLEAKTILLVFAALAVCGVALQFLTTKKK